jgi:hypothetical protein
MRSWHIAPLRTELPVWPELFSYFWGPCPNFPISQGPAQALPTWTHNGDVIRAEGNVQTHVNPVLARQLVANPDAVGKDRPGEFESLEMVPRPTLCFDAAETDPSLSADYGASCP